MKRMNEREIREKLKQAANAAQKDNTPSFDETWVIAESHIAESGSGYGRYGAIAAAAIALIAVTIALWPAQQADLADDYFIADALLNSTSWTAPSDALMPEHQFDIYQGIPLLDESTKLYEGSLL
ncbi:MAG: hypothetical protein ACR2Q3_00995 [Woeseiaceae bacterium]